MCVVIVKPAGVSMPSEAVLRAAYMTNPHGCGFVSENHYFRSLDFNAFMAHIAKVRDDEACIIHFRLATHGSVKKANCHPFRNGDVFFAHNGILDITPQGDMTDSQTAFNRIIYPVISCYGWRSRMVDSVAKVIAGSSKFAMLKGNDIVMVGDFIHDYDGCYYSNMRWTCNLHGRGYYNVFMNGR